jgi:hypothetical protein
MVGIIFLRTLSLSPRNLKLTFFIRVLVILKVDVVIKRITLQWSIIIILTYSILLSTFNCKNLIVGLVAIELNT